VQNRPDGVLEQVLTVGHANGGERHAVRRPLRFADVFQPRPRRSVERHARERASE
jgi:hypothetical protein